MTRLLGFAILGGMLLMAASPAFAAHIGMFATMALCIDAGSKDPAAGTKVVLTPCRATDGQNFLIKAGHISIKGTEKCLELGPEVDVGNNAKFPLAVINPCDRAPTAQQWKIGARIENGSTKQKCLSVIGIVKGGAHIGMAACSANKGQEFGIE